MLWQRWQLNYTRTHTRHANTFFYVHIWWWLCLLNISRMIFFFSSFIYFLHLRHTCSAPHTWIHIEKSEDQHEARNIDKNFRSFRLRLVIAVIAFARNERKWIKHEKIFLNLRLIANLPNRIVRMRCSNSLPSKCRWLIINIDLVIYVDVCFVDHACCMKRKIPHFPIDKVYSGEHRTCLLACNIYCLFILVWRYMQLYIHIECEMQYLWNDWISQVESCARVFPGKLVAFNIDCC